MHGVYRQIQKRVLTPYFLLCFIYFVFLVYTTPITFAASYDLHIETAVGNDNTPPSIPTGLVATPITTSHIYLTWNTSTDDFTLSGYQIWRDGIQVATTTNTVYDDIGLTPATVYTYYIVAFDTSKNFSASSTDASAITLAPPLPPSPLPVSNSFGTYTSSRPHTQNEITFLEILPQKDSVIFRYDTQEYMRSVLKWGESSSYEIGSLAESAFTKHHEIKVEGLLPGTIYQYAIEGYDKYGVYTVVRTETFKTVEPDDIFPPAQVQNLKAVKDGDDILLTWNNPHDSDFTKVRILRNDRFYPVDTADGWFVYEGNDEEIRDVGAAKSAEVQFYTVFTYDMLGNISSGAVVKVSTRDNYLATTTPDTIDPTQNSIALALTDVGFSQEGSNVVNENGVVHVDGSKQLTISIPYERLPQHLKTIIVTLTDAQDPQKIFTFLLHVNTSKTAYTSILAPLGVSGRFPVRIAVFDFNTSQIGYTDGIIAASIRPTTHDSNADTLMTGFIRFTSSPFGLVIAWSTVGVLLFQFVRRRFVHI